MRRVQLLFLAISLTVGGPVFAEPDYYYGDANVFVGSATGVRPNIMIFVDSSQQMGQLGTMGRYIYTEDIDYSLGLEEPKEALSLYTAFKGGWARTNIIMDSSFKARHSDEYQTLISNGGVLACLSQNDTANCKTDNYYTGDYINWKDSSDISVSWVSEGIYAHGTIVHLGEDTEGIKFTKISENEVIIDNLIEGFPPLVEDFDPLKVYVYPKSDGTKEYWRPLSTMIDLVADVLNNVVFKSIIDRANVGLMHYPTVAGDTVLVPTVVHVDTDELENSVKSIIRPAPFERNANQQRLASVLWDSGRYFAGRLDQNNETVYNHSNTSELFSRHPDNAKSPTEYWCQPNHVIVIAAGDDKENPSETGLTDRYEEGYLDDVANSIYSNLGLSVDEQPVKVNTHIIQVLTQENIVMQSAADLGRGNYVYVESPDDFLEAILAVVGGILEADSSFVAPVVPASPESQAYSGQRIYLGFFTPKNNEPWCGNVKKFVLDYDNRMLGFDSEGNLTAATDKDGNFIVDAAGDPAVGSFWSAALDGGEVDAGGVGGLLFDAQRTIYTLSYPSDPLVKPSLKTLLSTTGTLNVDETDLEVVDLDEAQRLVEFIYGDNSYNDSYDGVIPDERRWIKGDVMHSKPVIVNYKNYPFTDENEALSTQNETYIFVGGNDGMLHAYRDHDGSEAWSFVPNELLPHLKYLRDFDKHYYFVDGSPVVYIHDANNDGNIDELTDKVLLMFGMRRGGGKSTLGEGSSLSTYYAFDITNPEAPVFKWKINGNTTGFAEMGQTWSLPAPAKMKIGSETKIVAVIGGGYDPNEDLRFGLTQTFPQSNEATVTSLASDGEGQVTSLDGYPPHQPKGRALYFIEIATIDENGVSLNDGGDLIKGFTNADFASMTYSFPSDPLVVDSNFDGYADTVYIGDTGGQMWRFEVGSSDATKWNGTRIFAANESNSPSTDVGRKIFYKPTATISGYDTFLFFGTGDREHPLNTTVVDRFYMVRDRRVPTTLTDSEAIDLFESTYAVWPYASPLTEVNLVDVTLNALQDDDTLTESQAENLQAKLTSPSFIDLDGTTWYGWYIRLNETNHQGEKVLASARVFDRKVYFTTYQPTAHTQDDDPCAGVLGPARLYVVDAFTGEAVFNLYKANDADDGTAVLDRRDRYYQVGRGIASEAIVKLGRDGNVSVMVGRGGGFFNSVDNENVDLGTFDPLFPIYWMKW